MGNKTFVLALYALASCTRVEYQAIKIDLQNRQVSVLSNDFVIDSVSIEKFGRLYFSKSLVSKKDGSHQVSIGARDNGYRIQIDSLSLLQCGEDNLNLVIIIRRMGSNVRVTRNIAMNFEHVDEIQTLHGVKYSPCSKSIDTLMTDKRWR